MITILLQKSHLIPTPAHERVLFEIMNLTIFLKTYIIGLRCAMKFQKKIAIKI